MSNNPSKLPDYLMKGRKVGRPRKKKATERQRKFAREYIATGSVAQAAQATNYSGTQALMKNPIVQAEIEKYRKKVEDKFLVRAEEMSEQLYNLILTTDSDSVKLNAIKDWLDRAGFKPVDKSQITSEKIISAESKVSTDLINRLNNLKNFEKPKEKTHEQS